jgi:hypothetical protein
MLETFAFEYTIFPLITSKTINVGNYSRNSSNYLFSQSPVSMRMSAGGAGDLT